MHVFFVLVQMGIGLVFAAEVLTFRRGAALPLPAFLRARFARSPWSWNAGAAAAGATLAVAPLAISAFSGWVEFQATAPDGVRFAALALATVALKLFWAGLEEMIFRGAMLPWVSRRAGTVAGVAASAAFFALAHLREGPADPWGVAVRAADGVLYAALVLATGSLWPAVLAHAAKNVALWAATGATHLQLVEGFGRVTWTGPALWVGTRETAGVLEVLVAAGIAAAAAQARASRLRSVAAGHGG